MALHISALFEMTYFTLPFPYQGHCRPREIPLGDQKLLPRRRWSPPHLRHIKPRLFQLAAELAHRREKPGQSQHCHHSCGQQEGPGSAAGGLVPGGESVCQGQRLDFRGVQCFQWREC